MDGSTHKFESLFEKDEANFIISESIKLSYPINFLENN
jgi:hypothetical protein